MPIEQEQGEPAAADSDRPRKTPWRKRPTVWSLKRTAQADRDIHRAFDEEANDNTRLPDSETLHLGGLILTEVFPPSAIASLYKALERRSADHGRAHRPLAFLARSRSDRSGGWQRLGVVLPSDKRGAFVGLEAFYDSALPDGVEAVWLDVRYLTPSLAVVVATFSFSEEAGDLAELMRADYWTKHVNARVEVWGRFGALRARVPWARPARYRSRSSMSSAEDQKRLAIERRIRELERAGSQWFFSAFAGRFARLPDDRRPVIRVLFTSEADPLCVDGRWPSPAGLSHGYPQWRSTGSDAWRLSEDRWLTFSEEQKRQQLMTLFGRRGDVAASRPAGAHTTTNWALVAGLSEDFSGFAAYYALRALLSLYGDLISTLRDSAGERRLFQRPVGEARDLDGYLIRDGLDAATVVVDVEALTEDLGYFRYGIAEFVEDDHRWEVRNRLPREYVPELHAELKERARQLTVSTTAVTGNIQASAQLRQSIANTKLQRLTLVVSLAATALAILSLIAARGS